MKNSNPFIPNSSPDVPEMPFDFGEPQASPPTAPASGPASMPTSGSGVSPSAGTFEVDLSKVQSSYTVPDGEYTLQLVGVEQGMSKAENPMYIWDFIIVDDPQYAGREFKVFTALTPSAMWKVAETVEALGIGAQGSVVRFTREQVISRRCKGIIEKTEYDGVERSQIQTLSKL